VAFSTKLAGGHEHAHEKGVVSRKNDEKPEQETLHLIILKKKKFTGRKFF
jgi:hypothetical protein